MSGQKSRARDEGEGRGFRLLCRAYMFWVLVILFIRLSGGCNSEALCRVSASADASVLVLVAPLALILAGLPRRQDEGVRLLLIAVAAGAVLIAPHLVVVGAERLLAAIG